MYILGQIVLVRGLKMGIQFYNDLVLFDTDKISFESLCCCGGLCDECDPGTAPAALQVDITGVGDFFPITFCKDCAVTFNGSHILPKVTNCIWTKTIPFCSPSPCIATIQVVKIGAGLNGYMRITGCTSPPQIVRHNQTPVSGDCSSWNGLSLPWFSGSGGVTACPLATVSDLGHTFVVTSL